ncbi:MAG: TIGR00159 family protein [Tenericutes bacterium GWC2_34_14]|nr:MAG: TIGR00159 family protein [Tenericutes bacterium GWC2_34_14]OHE32929.1 MAG: TIGR00159 family protein [Tenericutes bacterium GWE2_34_108]OHE36106.1 MAG: TIGR00159 family protein [Tenericutes bacterium GWF1_35_14]OHE39329.1 MAG: TIGR00159 family protein [Tenericutes bacterium GWF2_35_184]OHE43812.1 MAG: TIGR00159 family protein [Tenericutes bacterium RIFOXYA12_FULL_35_10]OHE44602.1 MAG: TIGR00159 family protein [Tenericutes bacterium RIFOXYA2_FULL_36_32]OHE48006.1 MAG: TIGR00159 family p
MIFGVPIWKVIVDAYFVWVLVVFLVKFLLSNKRMLSIASSFVLIYILALIANYFDLLISSRILSYLTEWLPILIIVIMAPDIRRSLEFVWKADSRNENVVMGSERTKQAIVDAAMYLSSQQIGALMTIEKHNTLDQYAERAIMMNSEVSKEVLINIFTPNTPLHDGAVIIRGDTILCAGAYFVLSDNTNFEKTTGSRHRAGLGISEITDSLTIIVSEETGSVSIAVEGIMLKINDRDKLMEYINMFMK